MVSETGESFVKLPHDDTLIMEQVSSEHHVHGGSTSVGWHIPAALLALCGGRLYQKPKLVSKSGSDGVRDWGKLCEAASCLMMPH